MSDDTLTMRQVAPLVGLSYDRFRKVWKAKVREEGFPQPFSGLKWDAGEIRDWRHRRSQRGAETAAPAADPLEPSPRRAARARAQLAELRAG